MNEIQPTNNLFYTSYSKGVEVAHACIETLMRVVEKIKNFIYNVFAFIIDFICFPMRYIGSKNYSIPGLVMRVVAKPLEILGIKAPPPPSSGYQTKLVPLETEEAKRFARYGTLCAYVHSAGEKSQETWLKPFGYEAIRNLPVDLTNVPGDLEAREYCFYDPKNRLKIALTRNGDEVFMVFGALRSGLAEEVSPMDEKEKTKLYQKKISEISKQQYTQITEALLGFRLSFYEEASAFYESLMKHPEMAGKKITLVGQCLGGSVAQYLAIKYGVKAYCFNCLPLGAGLQYDLGDKKLSEAEKHIEHLTVETDFLSDGLPLVPQADWAISMTGVRTPGNFGKRFSIPTAYEGYSDTHDFVMGSLFKYIGYDIRTLPSDLDFNDEKLGLKMPPVGCEE